MNIIRTYTCTYMHIRVHIRTHMQVKEVFGGKSIKVLLTCVRDEPAKVGVLILVLHADEHGTARVSQVSFFYFMHICISIYFVDLSLSLAFPLFSSFSRSSLFLLAHLSFLFFYYGNQPAIQEIDLS